MMEMRVCTMLQHSYTNPSNDVGGSGGAGKNGARVTKALIVITEK